MARTQPPPPFSPLPVIYDPYLDLSRLLSRLDRNILRADGDKWRRLVGDEFQRQQARFDVAAARNLLARVEQDTQSIKAHARRQETQGELSRRRALVEQLQERLDDLDEEARTAAAMAEDDDGGDEMEDDGEGGSSSLSSSDDVLAHIIQTPSESMDSRSTDMQSSGLLGEEEEEETAADGGLNGAVPNQPESSSAAKKKKRVRIARLPRRSTRQTSTPTPTTKEVAATTTTTSAPQATMRARKGQAASGSEGTGRSTSAQAAEGGTDPSTTTLRSALLSRSGDDATSSAVATEEVLLDHHRHEQEVLSEDILRLAKALKERSLTTSRMLEDDKDVVDRVGEGLHKTNESLSAASRSMAVLTRMTEGKGWWGRMLLFGMVYGLIVVLLLLFFFLPKLRL